MPTLQPPHGTASTDDDISLFEFCTALLAEWKLVSLIVAVAAACSVALAFLLPEKFTAEVVIVEKADRATSSASAAMLGKLGGLAQFAGIDLSALGAQSDNAAATLRSRYLLNRFITDNDLLPILFPDKWDATAGRWTTSAEDTPTVWLGVKYFSEHIYTVKDDLTQGTTTLQVEWRDPALAARWANGLVDLANEIVRTRALAEAQHNLAYLNQELSRTSVLGLQQVLYGLVETEMKTMMLANDRNDYAFTVIDPAVAPELRSFPSRPLVAIAGTVFGGFIAMLAVLVRLLIRIHRSREVAAR